MARHEVTLDDAVVSVMVIEATQNCLMVSLLLRAVGDNQVA